jgi:hypothetical protein
LSKFDDGLRWYHALFAAMVGIPFFLIAIVPDGYWGWPVMIGFAISVITGLILIFKVPPAKRKSKRKIEG